MRPIFSNKGGQRFHDTLLIVVGWLCVLLLAACQQSPAADAQPTSRTVTIEVDGRSQTITTAASTVREALAEAGVTLGELDEVEPPPFTPLENDLTITVARVSESLEVIQQTIPFERKLVRSESMDEDDPPRILQAGEPGLQETTWRIVYRDGLEVERFPTNTVVVEQPQDEIVMIGIGAARSNVTFDGLIAYMSNNTAVLLRGETAFPTQLDTGGRLDGRVFSLSPDGGHLLYTRTISDTTTFSNSLWVVSTAPGAEPRPLGVENVLWAGWNPARTELLQIAYTTARPTDAPPGWEANNDLWLGDVARSEEADFEPEQVIDAYPATYGWWGGNYAWSPNGRTIAYSFADEVGIINVDDDGPIAHTPLTTFTEFNTLSNWVWVPTLTWSPDGRFLAATLHGSDDPQAMQFDSWVIDTQSGAAGEFVRQSGMWGHLNWTSVNENGIPNGQIAFLRAIDPVDSQRSNYTLWLMDQDGSNARQIYPPVGENSRFPLSPDFMAWGPNGQNIALIFDDDLYLLNLTAGTANRVTQDDAITGHPTWAPYGAALTAPAALATPTPPATAEPRATIPPQLDDLFLPDEP